jgi:cell division protein YceG involved in septum cleavage
MERNLEGYLMSETYFVNPEINEKQLIEMMYDEFNKKVTPDICIRGRKKLMFLLKI